MRGEIRSVDDYIAAQPATIRPVLARVRAAIRKAIPRATEGISYQLPVYKIDGAMVLHFAGYQRHWSLYPATPELLLALGDKIEARLHAKATLRFSLDEVPVGLITRIAKLRAAETTRASTSPAKTSTRRPPQKSHPQSPPAAATMSGRRS